MSDPLETLNEDPVFGVLKKHGLRFVDDADDPETAYEEYEKGDLDAAYESLGIDPEEAQLELDHLVALAQEVRENNPEAFAQLQAEYGETYGQLA